MRSSLVTAITFCYERQSHKKKLPDGEKMRIAMWIVGLAAASTGSALADPAVIEDAVATVYDGKWTFEVTLSHGDTGWDDYADGWRILLPDGTILGTRELLHPHVDEQPFTRSLAGVEVPPGVDAILIEARTNVEGWGAQRFELNLD